MKLLHVDSAITGANSVSRQLTQAIVAEWKAANPGATVDYLDLAVNAPGHLDGQVLSGGFKDEVSERLVSQFLAANVIVVGAPLYNFSIPGQLKAWIDRLAQAGRTFRYTEKGPEGLAQGKTVIVASSRGGFYSNSEMGRALEHQESYLQAVFGFFGITDVRFVRAEGVNMGPEAKAKAISDAQASIKPTLAANQAQAKQTA
ncbi:FMN-dependent NADH-azoreductase [Hylemonella gracilis str. Niagara R]|uniref:FMN dependent NADH:quinone oxidoreductase n=1 Tax=Hylemonella gracilis str. Niagara R TaxID=1458275 RepID=A0A016XIN9_9BURK|nr:FMN-dependent NADH-azoreductase [Hylemonella gracilis]EYC51033.1 FMN-dependent NADH-azoreductase [Hylemonella gracilis str. Niagara R]